jgi:hypothetical protein
MRKTYLVLTVIFLMVALGGVLKAENFKLMAGGVSLWLPDDWEIDGDEEEGALYADAPDGDSFCVLQVLAEANDLSTAMATYSDALSEEMDEFHVTREASQSQLNGFNVFRIGGEGLRDEKTWSVDVLLIATGKATLMCAFGWEKDQEGKFAPRRDTIFASIKKID